MTDDWLTDEELAAVLRAALRTGPKPMDQLEVCADWARQARVSAAALRMVLSGELWLDVQDERDVLLVLPKAA